MHTYIHIHVYILIPIEDPGGETDGIVDRVIITRFIMQFETEV